MREIQFINCTFNQLHRSKLHTQKLIYVGIFVRPSNLKETNDEKKLMFLDKSTIYGV